MHSRSAALLSAVLTVSLACFAACGDDPAGKGGPGSPSGEEGGAGDGAGGPIGSVRAEFGLDRRPPNPTCLAPARPPAAGGAKLERVYDGVTLERPMAMAQPPGDPTRWFVAERDGLVVSFSASAPAAQPAVVANLAALSGKPVQTDLEGGFLGFAFHPKFAQNGRLYVSFTTNGSVGFGSEVGYLTSTNQGASFTAYTRVLLFDRPRLEHCGGGIAFGTDGLLYLSFGDGTVVTNAQSKDNFFGKVLRIDVDNVPAGKTYGIPDGNPFKAGGGQPETFAWGFRNPFRLSIDRGTGDVWVGDVGDASWDEIDRVERGANYGWPCREGMHDHPNADPAACPSTIGLVDPVVEHAHAPTPNSRSIIGGVVYRGGALPALEGTYVYGDLIRLEAWALSFDAVTGAAAPTLLNENGPQTGWSGFHEGADGEIYATALFQNAIYKLMPTTPAAAGAPFPEQLSKTGCVDPADPRKPAGGLVPYGVNAELWSDGAAKERFLALPDGQAITVAEDGDFGFPIGSVLVKNFSLAGKRVETRLFVRHEDGDWAGYSYEWNEAQTDAALLPAGKSKIVGDVTWTFPSRSDCKRCHTSAAGHTLGLELGQLNGDHLYGETNRTANQLQTLEHIQMFAAPLGRPAAGLVAYPAPFGTASPEARARAYLHGNCSGCHRPNGGAARSTMDLRFATAFEGTNTCGTRSELDDLGVAGAVLVAPNAPEKSILSLRIHATGAKRMPPLGTRRVDARGVDLIDTWIRTVQVCP